MRITASQLRTIIKEEVSRMMRSKATRRRSLREAVEPDSFIEIPNISEMGNVADVINVIKKLASKYLSVSLEGVASPGANPYSRQSDSLHVVGERGELTSFVRELEEEFMGGAQSMSDEDRLESMIEYF